MSTARDLFRLATLVAESHSRSTPGTVTVVPVLVDDLSSARLVFQALCQLTNGRMFDANDDELQSPVPLTDDPVRLAAISQALRTDLGDDARHVVFDPPEAPVDAAFANPPAGAAPSGGERAVLGVARAVAHAEFDSHELVVLMWSDATVDYLFSKALWNLAVGQLQDLEMTTLRTVVVVVEAAIEVPQHCQRHGGFMLAHQGGRLLERHGPDDVAQFASTLADRTTPIVLFLGAGFGSSSRLPMGNSLRDDAIRHLFGLAAGEPLTSDELGRRFHAWISRHPAWTNDELREMPDQEYARQLTLEQVVDAESRNHSDLPTLTRFREHHDRVIGTPGQGALDLGRILKLRPGWIVIVEVNFDTLVETVSVDVPLRVFHTEDTFAGADEHIRQYLAGDSDEVPVLKLHGSIDDPSSCVVTTLQTGLGVGPHKLAALRALRDHEETLPLIYVGASMRDRDLAGVFGSQEWADMFDERWVSPYLVETVEAFGRSREDLWKASPHPTIETRLITETSDEFFAELLRQIERRQTGGSGAR